MCLSNPCAICKKSHNTEKVIYFLLLERKRKRPAFEDELEEVRNNVRSSNNHQEDPPKKRIDTCRVNGNTDFNLGQISQGSPLTPRKSNLRQHTKRQVSVHSHGVSSVMSSSNVSACHVTNISDSRKMISLQTNQVNTSKRSSSVTSYGKENAHQISDIPQTSLAKLNVDSQDVQSVTGIEENSTESSHSTTTSGIHPWRSRLNTIKNSFLGSPRFHRRKLLTSTDDVQLTPESSPEFTKKSWFGNLMMTEKDETFTILIKGKPLAILKADLIHAFLSITELSHNVSSPTSFRVEYRRNSTGPIMFQRQVRFRVDLNEISKQSPEILFAITFTLLNGNIRRFRRICEHIQSQVSSRSVMLNLGTSGKGNSQSPRTSRKPSLEMSESSSCGSDTSDKLVFIAPQSISKQMSTDHDQEHSSLEIHSHCRNSFNNCSTSASNYHVLSSNENIKCENAADDNFVRTESENDIA